MWSLRSIIGAISAMLIAHDHDIVMQGSVYKYSDIRCDPVGMSCLVTNMIIDNHDQHILHVDPSRQDHLVYSGFFGHLGIGEPAAYYYIDTWTKKGTNAFLRDSVRVGYRRVQIEKELYPNTRFIPIFIDKSEPQIQPELQHIKGLTILVQTLWQNNFFRKLYIGAASLTTCHYWLSASYCHPSNINIIHYHEPPNPYILGKVLSRTRSVHLEYVILGISKRVLLPEQDILMLDHHDLNLMSRGYRQYSHILTCNIRCSSVPSRNIFVYRRGNHRHVLNWSQLVDKFNLTITILEDYSFEQQVCLMRNLGSMTAVHGAAMAHILFMPQNSLTIELFPCDFKKTIYRNLALVMGVNYRWWQAGNVDDCPQLPTEPLDWSDIKSKNRYRNQNFMVDIVELQKVFEFNSTTDLFLTYMPFEQFNNQLISLRCACGIANVLNRTLVIPEIGYNMYPIGSKRLVYEPKNYKWQPISRYFNTTTLYENLPCKTTPFSAYYGQVRSIDRIYFRRLGAKYNTRAQPESYYYHIAGQYYRHHRSLPNHQAVYQNSTDLVYNFGDYQRSLRYFALGNVFWMYQFDADLTYPITRYVDIYTEGNHLYKQIADSLVYNDRYYRAIANADGLSGAIHWRRGDYKSKCAEELYPMKCYPSYKHLLDTLQYIDPNRVIKWTILSNKKCQKLRLFLTRHQYKIQPVKNDNHKMDPIEMAIIDQITAIQADYFIGNMYSSFTRTIVDKRRAAGLPVDFF